MNKYGKAAWLAGCAARVRRRSSYSGRAASCLVLALMLALSLAGCGKKGAPQPPTDVPNTYPKVYPSD